jgi:hypothetical protein
VRQPVGGGQRQVQRDGIGDPRTVEVRGDDLPFVGERSDLRRRAMDENHPDVQRPIGPV